MMQNKRGFTIVELLIVIVVVAILAAITIVTYSGIQTRAEKSAREADISFIQKSLGKYNVTHEDYPGSISDCPNPSEGNLCLTSSIKSDIRYERYAASPAGGSNAWTKQGYSIGLMDKNQFILQVDTERRGNNEFNRFVDIAPYIDKYGVGTYELSFDLRSENTSTANKVQVYLQNGSGMRYFFSNTITVSTDYKRYTLEVTPTVSNLDIQEAYLAFYGSYHTGNVPIVKNVTLSKK